MRLWLLEAPEVPDPKNPERTTRQQGPWSPWYDKAFGFVVRAETEAEARQFAAEQGGDENPSSDSAEGSPWLDASLSSCVNLTAEGPAGVILKDFWSA